MFDTILNSLMKTALCKLGIDGIFIQHIKGICKNHRVHIIVTEVLKFRGQNQDKCNC